METQWEQQAGGRMWPEKETNVGESVEGKCVSIENGKYGQVYTIEGANGKLTALKSVKALLPRMIKVHVGTIVKIVYTGTEPTTKGNPMLLFDVFIAKPPPVAPVGSPIAGAIAPKA